MTWFNEFVLSEAYVKSGTENERRIMYSTYHDFYEAAYIPNVTKHPEFIVRTYQTIVGWLHQLRVKRAKFDRYRCERCFDGRIAETSILKGATSPQIEIDFEKYSEHM